MLLALAFVVAAQPGVIDSWNVPVWGSFSSDDAGYRFVAPGSRIDLWSIACDPTAVNHETGEGSYECFPARLRLPEYAPSTSGEYASAREELARIRRCFDVRLQKAPPSVVAAAVTRDMSPATHIVQQQSTPTLVVVAWAYFEEGGYMRQFDVFSNMVSGNNEWRPIAIPAPYPVDQITVAIVEAPGAHDVVAAIRAKKYRTALTRAKAALRSARADIDDDTKGALRANVASAAILAGSKRDVVADDGFNDIGVDSANGTAVDLARRWAKGEVWLGPDPCAR
jgi:hypothetical protein